MRVFSFSWLLMIATVLSSGCNRSDSWKAKTYSASGTVSINGTPPDKAVLYLKSLGSDFDSRGSSPYAMVSSDGTFKFTTYKPFDGAPEGEYALTIIWPLDPRGPSPDRLGGAFAKVEQSPLKVKIVKRKNVLPPIELKDVKIVNAPPKPKKGPPQAFGPGFTR